jgi:microcystin degradation protein MlrC
LAPFSSNTGYLDAKDFLQVYSGTKSVPGGFIDAAENLEFELVPSIWADTTPGGTVSADAFDYLISHLLESLRNCGKLDGILLGLHGGACSEVYNDVEGKVLQEIRAIFGKDMPIVTTLDPHSNVSQLMVDAANIIVGYDTYPHVDMYERGIEAANLIVSTIKSDIKPTMAMEKPPLIIPLQGQFTGKYPMNKLMDLAHEMEQEKDVINVTVSASFPLTDCVDTGITLIVTTNDNPELAKEKAKQLSDLAWSMRREFLVKPVPINLAVKEAMLGPGPTVLADIGDNPGTGGACDGVELLRELMKANAKNTVFAIVKDPEAVSKAIQAGVGKKVKVNIGGKTDRLHGDPLDVTGYVRLISDGRFRNQGPMSAGIQVTMGRTVVLDCNGIEVILTELRRQPMDLQLFRSVGIDPSERDIVVVKSNVHFRAAFTPIAKKIIEVDTPGITGSDLKRFPFKKVRRPIFPLDDI